MATQTSTVYANIIRARHGGPNFMDAQLVATNTVSASDGYLMFQLPADCTIIRGHWSGSLPSGVSGQAVLKLGTPLTDNLIATLTVSGGAATPKTAIYGPITLSSSGTSGTNPIVFTVNSAPSATTSLSLYLLLEYVLPGNVGP